MCVRRKNVRLESGEQEISPTEVCAVPVFEPPTPAAATNPNAEVPFWLHSQIVWKNIQCWLLPPELSQSKFADRNQHSSACTLIAVTVAKSICFAVEARLPRLVLNHPSFVLPEWMLHVICTAMVDGNDHHARAMMEREEKFSKDGNNNNPLKDTFTVPQAIQATGGGVHEIDWMICKGPCHTTLGECIIQAITSPVTQSLPAMFFVVIVLERAIMIYYDRRTNTIAVFDSHSRRKAKVGSMMSMAPDSHVRLFCYHIIHEYFPDLKPETDHMEISSLQILASDSSSTGSEKSGKSQERVISVRLFPRQLATSAARRK